MPCGQCILDKQTKWLPSIFKASRSSLNLTGLAHCKDPLFLQHASDMAVGQLSVGLWPYTGSGILQLDEDSGRVLYL